MVSFSGKEHRRPDGVRFEKAYAAQPLCIPQRCSRQLVNTGIDLIPTLCGFAGIDWPSHLDGQDWSTVLSGSDLPLQRDHVIMEDDPGETINLAGSADHQEELDRHRALLRDDYIDQTEDIFAFHDRD